MNDAGGSLGGEPLALSYSVATQSATSTFRLRSFPYERTTYSPTTCPYLTRGLQVWYYNCTSRSRTGFAPVKTFFLPSASSLPQTVIELSVFEPTLAEVYPKSKTDDSQRENDLLTSFGRVEIGICSFV